MPMRTDRGPVTGAHGCRPEDPTTPRRPLSCRPRAAGARRESANRAGARGAVRRSSGARRYGSRYGCLGALLLATSCRRSVTEPTEVPLDVRVARTWVTGAAAAALATDGHFHLANAHAVEARNLGEAEAQSLAVAWARMVGRAAPLRRGAVVQGTREVIERIFGAPVDFAALRACGRPLFAESPYGPLGVAFPRAVRNSFGAKWVVRLCTPQGHVPVVVAIAAAADAAVVAGQLSLPDSSGGVFSFWSTRRGQRPVPLEPETAVDVAFRATGRRIAEVPRYVRITLEPTTAPVLPPCGHWLLELESPVRVRSVSSGAIYETRQVRVASPGCVTERSDLYARPLKRLAARYLIPWQREVDGRVVRDTLRVPVGAEWRFEAVEVLLP